MHHPIQSTLITISALISIALIIQTIIIFSRPTVLENHLDNIDSNSYWIKTYLSVFLFIAASIYFYVTGSGIVGDILAYSGGLILLRSYTFYFVSLFVQRT